VFNGSYYKIDDAEFLIKVTDFKKMKKNTEYKIYTYNEDGYQRRYLYIKKLDDKSLKYGEDIYNLILKTTDRQVFTTKKPHQLLIDSWDSRIEEIKSSIKEKLVSIDAYEKSDLKNLSTNLFVDKSNVNLIVEKIEELKVNITQLEVNCDELLDKYQDIEDGKVIETISKKTRRSKRG